MFDPEWDVFKTAIDLRAYAVSEGYVVDRKESWRGSAVMRHANGDKIIVSRRADGHYTFFSVRQGGDGDSGTIIDFIKRRKQLSFVAIRGELRGWVGMPVKALPQLPELVPIAKDRPTVQARYYSMPFAYRHPYLERERCLPVVALQHWRFGGRIRIDRYSNAVFPHFDADGLCGYELRNLDFKGFSCGGTKGLWLSKTSASDRRLVVCESAIDAISHAVLFPDGNTRYASVGGKLNRIQPHLIRAQNTRMHPGSEIVAAMDADLGGEQLTDAIWRACSGVAAHNFRRQHPVGFKDWNDQLRAFRKSAGCHRPAPVVG